MDKVQLLQSAALTALGIGCLAGAPSEASAAEIVFWSVGTFGALTALVVNVLSGSKSNPG